jgi:predicted DNA-binding protein
MKTITIRLPDEEKESFDRYCKAASRTQTDVLREFIRAKIEESRPKRAGLESH